MSGMSHAWIGARALLNRRRSQRGRHPTSRSNPGSNPGSPPLSPTSPSVSRKEGYEPLEIQVTEPEVDENEQKRKGEEEAELKKAVEEVLDDTNRLEQRFLSETAALVHHPSPCATRPYSFQPSSRRSSTSVHPDPGLSVSRRASYSETSPRPGSRRKRSGYVCVSRFDPRAEAEWRELQDDLMVFAKMRDVSLHSEWLSDNYGIGSYRYIHYTAYANEKQGKLLDGTIESIFTSTCCCCCVGCSPAAVRIFIKDANNDDVMTIKLTGKVTKFPLDTAQLQTPSGKTFATVKWRKRTFFVQSTDGTVMFQLRLKRCWPCNLQRKHMILSGDGEHTIGWITAKNNILGAEWNAGKIISTSVPRALDVRQKASWVSLLFLMKLYNKGKEYAKVQLHDS